MEHTPGVDRPAVLLWTRTLGPWSRSRCYHFHIGEPHGYGGPADAVGASARDIAVAYLVGGRGGEGWEHNCPTPISSLLQTWDPTIIVQSTGISSTLELWTVSIRPCSRKRASGAGVISGSAASWTVNWRGARNVPEQAFGLWRTSIRGHHVGFLLPSARPASAV